MRTLRAMLVEDDKQTAEELEQTMDLEFARFGQPVSWRRCPDALTARLKVKDEPPFDFALVDLMLGENRENGLAVVKDLHARDADTYVLLVTGDPKTNAAFVDDALRSGATRALARQRLTQTHGEWKFSDLAADIQAHLVKVGKIRPDIMGYKDGDVGVLSLLETLGGYPQPGAEQRGLSILRGLAMQTLRPPSIEHATFWLAYITQGRSGAHVCRITVDPHQPGLPVEHHVLKVGLDRRAMESERLLNGKALSVLGSRVLVATEGPVEADSSGYCAIAAKHADDTVTLDRWLADAGGPVVRSVVKVLFREHLRRLYAAELCTTERVRDWLRTQPLTRLKVDEASVRFRPALIRAGGYAPGDADELLGVIADFTRTGSLAVRQESRMGDVVQYAHGFGDLHSGNVLVGGGEFPSVFLIDASRFGPRHWASDAARLLVDLFLRIRGAGLDALLWDDFAASAEELAGHCPRCRSGPADPTAAGAVACIDELVGSLPEFVCVEQFGLAPDVWHWQWHVGLAKEFIRQAGHPDLTPSRAALALVAAATNLRAASQVLDGWS